MQLEAYDANARVTGRLEFVQDVVPPGTLETAIVRSREPHARIVRVDTSRAAAMPGVALAIDGAEMARGFGRSIAFGPVYRDQPALAIDKVRFVGEPVAAVVAADIDIARAAAELVEVEYESLPAVLDIDAALAPGAGLIHELERPAGTYGFSVGPAGTNTCSSFRLRKGDIEIGFAEAEEIVEEHYETPPVQHVPLEPHVSVVLVRGGRITAWTGTQTPYGVRTQLAELFGIPAGRVRVIVPVDRRRVRGQGPLQARAARRASLAPRRPAGPHPAGAGRGVRHDHQARDADPHADRGPARRPDHRARGRVLVRHRGLRRHRPSCRGVWRRRHERSVRGRPHRGPGARRLHEPAAGRGLPRLRLSPGGLGSRAPHGPDRRPPGPRPARGPAPKHHPRRRDVQHRGSPPRPVLPGGARGRRRCARLGGGQPAGADRVEGPGDGRRVRRQGDDHPVDLDGRRQARRRRQPRRPRQLGRHGPGRPHLPREDRLGRHGGIRRPGHHRRGRHGRHAVRPDDQREPLDLRDG